MKRQRLTYVLALLALLTAVSIASRSGAGEWSLNMGLQALRGNYIYSEATSTLGLTAGLSHRSSRWNASAVVALVGQSATGVTSFGPFFMADGEWSRHGGSSLRGMHGNYSGQDAYLADSDFRFGLGDIFLYGELLILEGSPVHPSLSLTAQGKLPTASEVPRFGTGKTDYGVGLAIRQLWAPYFVFASAGHMRLGDPDGVTYKDPLSLTFGAGRTWLDGRFSLLGYYESYTEIIAGFPPPRQIGIIASNRLLGGQTVTVGGTFGLTDSSPDVLVSFGVQFPLR